MTVYELPLSRYIHQINYTEMTNNSYHFNEQKEQREKYLKTTQAYISTNQYLNSFNWLFISPLYNQGIEIEEIEKMNLSGNTDPNKIIEIFKHKFYDIEWSASFIRGHCNHSKFIAPFTTSIENSMILAYQRDYEGAIKTILPIIEGILRQYLTCHRNYTGRIQYSTLTNSLNFLKEDILAKEKVSLENFIDHNKQPVNFTSQQIEDLLSYEKQSYDIWFSFFSGFITQSLYKPSHGSGTNGELNRHDIFHVFTAQPFDYSIQNYLKLYMSIHFLVWAFLILEGKSLFREISKEDYLKTYLAYRKIIEGSKFLLEAKATLDDRYKPYAKPPMSFKERLVNLFIHNWAVKRK